VGSPATASTKNQGIGIERKKQKVGGIKPPRGKSERTRAEVNRALRLSRGKKGYVPKGEAFLSYGEGRGNRRGPLNRDLGWGIIEMPEKGRKKSSPEIFHFSHSSRGRRVDGKGCKTDAGRKEIGGGEEGKVNGKKKEAVSLQPARKE